MGCGSSRSPARVGVLVEGDEDALYPELYPALVDSWVQENAREDASFCNSSSPPPYTPLPLSGHVTLMYSHGSSPAKRQASVEDAGSAGGSGEGASPHQQANTTTSSWAETSLQDERRVSVASEADRAETEDAVVSVRHSLCETASEDHSSAVDGSTRVADDRERSRVADVATITSNTIVQSSIPTHTLQSIALSSSFPLDRPPSPYPRARSLSVQLPPLRAVTHHITEEQRTSTPLSLPNVERNAFRLPPLAVQRQQSAERDNSTGHLQRKTVRKRPRARSRSCTLQTSGLSSVQEQTVPILQ